MNGVMGSVDVERYSDNSIEYTNLDREVITFDGKSQNNEIARAAEGAQGIAPRVRRHHNSSRS